MQVIIRYFKLGQVLVVQLLFRCRNETVLLNVNRDILSKFKGWMGTKNTCLPLSNNSVTTPLLPIVL
jgi:hypothetical protein